jgi:predicted P-loop ATPase
MSHRRFNKDALNNVPVKDAATTTMGVITATQTLAPELQVVAITATFKLMLERYGITPADAFTVADNVMNNAIGRREEFAAVRDYMAGEL